MDIEKVLSQLLSTDEIYFWIKLRVLLQMHFTSSHLLTLPGSSWRSVILHNSDYYFAALRTGTSYPR